jgi:hypothetical protein
MAKNGGARPGAGRKKLWDQADILERVKGIQLRWWEEVEAFLDSRDKNDRKFALTEINKLQTKSLPTALTGEGGGPVQITWKSSSITSPEPGQSSSTPA